VAIEPRNSKTGKKQKLPVTRTEAFGVADSDFGAHTTTLHNALSDSAAAGLQTDTKSYREHR